MGRPHPVGTSQVPARMMRQIVGPGLVARKPRCRVRVDTRSFPTGQAACRSRLAAREIFDESRRSEALVAPQQHNSPAVRRGEAHNIYAICAPGSQHPRGFPRDLPRIARGRPKMSCKSGRSRVRSGPPYRWICRVLRVNSLAGEGRYMRRRRASRSRYETRMLNVRWGANSATLKHHPLGDGRLAERGRSFHRPGH